MDFTSHPSFIVYSQPLHPPPFSFPSKKTGRTSPSSAYWERPPRLASFHLHWPLHSKRLLNPHQPRKATATTRGAPRTNERHTHDGGRSKRGPSRLGLDARGARSARARPGVPAAPPRGLVRGGSTTAAAQKDRRRGRRKSRVFK